ncbi:MAG: hypothetical protein ONB14_12930 [candidate division KSB1 bacterium]|nr:hypothetical protein [candidate division KSB1 bacterium]
MLSYDAENRLTGVSGVATASYVYDGDGNHVKAAVNGTPTVYLGHYFEWTGSTATMKWYYYAGGARVAMRTGTTVTGTVNYLLPDHLGSTATTTDASGNRVTELRYMPYGGCATTPAARPQPTATPANAGTPARGLYFYGARW